MKNKDLASFKEIDKWIDRCNKMRMKNKKLLDANIKLKSKILDLEIKCFQYKHNLPDIKIKK